MDSFEIKKLDFDQYATEGENDFVQEVYNSQMDYLEVLNWYRCKYYSEPPHTERGLMSNAINTLLVIIKQHPEISQILLNHNKIDEVYNES